MPNETQVLLRQCIKIVEYKDCVIGFWAGEGALSRCINVEIDGYNPLLSVINDFACIIAKDVRVLF